MCGNPCITEVDTIKTVDKGYVWLYGYRPKSATAGMACSLGCNDSAAEAAYVAVVALHKWTLPSPLSVTNTPKSELNKSSQLQYSDNYSALSTIYHSKKIISPNQISCYTTGSNESYWLKLIFIKVK